MFNHELRPKRAMRDQLKSRHLAYWQNRPITSIDESDIQGVIDRFEAAARHVAAHKMRGALQTFFKWSILRKKLAGANPAAGVELIREASSENTNR
jgi:hypothetical protein